MPTMPKIGPEQIIAVAEELESLAKRLREDAARKHHRTISWDLDHERIYDNSAIRQEAGLDPELVEERFTFKVDLWALGGDTP